MPNPFTPGPIDEDLWALTQYLLKCGDLLDDLNRQPGEASHRLPDTVRTGSALYRTSLHSGKLLAQSALSDAATTVDGQEAIAILRRLTEATANAAARASDAVSALAHGDTALAERLLEQSRAHLNRTPVAVQDVSGALLRHDGRLYARELAARENLGTLPAVKVSEAQRKGLAVFARGEAVLHTSADGTREVVAPLAARMRATTVDALVEKKLIALTPLVQQGRYGVRLTAAGVQALLSAHPAQRRGPAATTPMPVVANSTARRAGARRYRP
ncbi:hypothetical protein BJP40_03720 [Streptomyces sp. CC53]|uniref:hypothetical protein n=1 Tax=Streptomyces sp. CC53 TaxID=1906740 RepID=UPI0008DCB926|nr:hypothetical protein [Streptomyces sp. CC53]OII62124.1 hypothetical protein BJP40_03720 [Streptomyces sp. CC53]